jgi:outer membrane immunogenic protein
MMNRKIAVSVALALGLPLAGAAHAATPFTGPYIGGQLGYSVYDLTLSAGGSSIEGFSGSGAEGGVFGGWGMKFSPVTYGGIEAEYNWSGAEHTTDGFKIEDGDNWGISARLGWLPANNVMLYGRMGWQRATLDYAGIEEDHDGARVGLGVEVAMTGNWLMRMDYAHTFYDDVTVDGANSEPDNDVFRVGISYQF